MNQELNQNLNWSALEYEEKEKSKDWFWALGIIIVTSSIASIIFDNYFFAALLLISGALLGFFAVKKPETIYYELNDRGLRIGKRLYSYESIKSFWVQLGHADQLNLKPIFFVHTERIFMPIISIPIDEELAQDIYLIMTSKGVAEIEMKEHPTDKIMEVLGF